MSNVLSEQERKYTSHLERLQTEYLDIFLERWLYLNEISVPSTDLPLSVTAYQ